MEKKMKICNGCDEEKVIWKNHEGNKYCQYCWQAIKFKKEGFKPKAQKPINPKSKKQQGLDVAYNLLRVPFMESHPMCEAHLPGCQGHSSDVHHVSQRGSNYLVVATWIAVCRVCHTWIHEHPKESREMNLLE